MSFNLKKKRGKVALILSDRVDVSEAGEIMAALQTASKSSIEVDMKGVESLDISSIQLLLAAKAEAGSNGVELRIVSKSEEADGVIKLAGAAEMLL